VASDVPSSVEGILGVETRIFSGKYKIRMCLTAYASHKTQTFEVNFV
jgi:hypothetical protein